MNENANAAGSVTLCIVFNHPYPKNIPLLRSIYKDRFSKIVFIQPIIQSPDEDVFTSARGSYNFSGSICDFLLNHKLETDYIVFSQDDVLINPRINEGNLSEWFGLDRFDCFLPHLHSIQGKVSNWLWNFQTYWRVVFPMSPVIGSGVEDWLRFLPAPEEFAEKVKRLYGFDSNEVEYDINGVGATWDYYAIRSGKEGINPEFFTGLFSGVTPGTKFQLPFPLCKGMSDFFVLRRDIRDRFVDYLTVFSALQLFAEIAIPTALALASSKIGRENDFGYDVNWLWGDSREQIKSEALVEAFRRNLLLLHPIKLSTDAPLVADIFRSFSANP